MYNDKKRSFPFFPNKLFDNNLEIIHWLTVETQLKIENGDIITKAKTNPDGGFQSVLTETKRLMHKPILDLI